MSDIAPLTLHTAFVTWSAAPIVDVLVMLSFSAYVAAMIRTRRWPVRRLVSWAVACLLVILTVNSWLAVYSHHLFWVHMVVHLILIMVVPAFAVWAEPIRLLHDAGNATTRRTLGRISKSIVFRTVISPGFTVPVYTAVLVLTHLTGFQQAMSEHMWLHTTELVLYLVVGYLLFLPLVGDELTTGRPPAPFIRFVVLAICMGPDTLVGVVLMMTGSPIAPAYSASRDWGPSALADQSAAGAIMWFGGDGLMMALMVVVGGLWVASGDRAGRSLGRWLDRARNQSTLGVDSAADIDDDDAALAAYNARLAELHRATTRPELRADADH